MFGGNYANCPLCNKLHDDGGIYILKNRKGERTYMFYCLDCDELRRKEVATQVLNTGLIPLIPTKKDLEEIINQDNET